MSGFTTAATELELDTDLDRLFDADVDWRDWPDWRSKKRQQRKGRPRFFNERPAAPLRLVQASGVKSGAPVDR